MQNGIVMGCDDHIVVVDLASVELLIGSGVKTLGTVTLSIPFSCSAYDKIRVTENDLNVALDLALVKLSDRERRDYAVAVKRCAVAL